MIPIGYVYEIINLINGKTYIGRRYLKLDKSWRDYLGSGKILKQAIERYGKVNFRKRFITYAYSLEDLINLETEWILKQRDKGLAQYNIFPTGQSGGDTFSKLKSKDLEAVKRKQSESLKNSTAHKEAVEKRIANRIHKELEIKSTIGDEIVLAYKEINHVRKVAKSFQIPARLVKEILDENEIELNYQNKGGNKMPEETKETISKSLKRHAPNPRITQICTARDCSKLVSMDNLSKFCSLLCKRSHYSRIRQAHKDSIKEDFVKAYMKDKLSCQELQVMFSLKQRSVYSLISYFGLPTFSNRE